MAEIGIAHTDAGKAGAAAIGPDFAVVKQRLEKAFPGLSPRLRQAARFVLDRPDDVALHSMRQLASIAGVHPSTMVRLARALDFSGYVNFREPFRQRLRGDGAGYVDRARHLQARGRDADAAALIDDMLTADLGNLRRSFAEIGVDPLGECVAALSAARRVYVVGLRSCYPVAFFFHYGWSMFEDKTVLLDGRGGTFADELRAIGEGDAMLAISFSPYTRDVVRAVSHAKDRGARILAITDSAVSPLARRADWPLIVSTDSPSFFHSVVPALAVVQALIALLAARGSEAALNALAESVDQLDSFRAYWDAPRGGSRGPGIRP